MNKEQVFDNFIHPLMRQVQELCLEHNISNVCTFSIPTKDDPELEATMMYIAERCNPPLLHKQLFNVIREEMPRHVNAYTKDENGIERYVQIDLDESLPNKSCTRRS